MKYVFFFLVAISVTGCGGSSSEEATAIDPAAVTTTPDTAEPTPPTSDDSTPPTSDESELAPSAGSLQLESISLVSVSSTNGSFLPLQEVSNGTVIALSSLPGNSVNFFANPQVEGEIGSVLFELDGPLAINSRIENSEPYTLFNASTNVNVTDGSLPTGEYNLVATPYSEPDLQGDAGEPIRVSFSVVYGEIQPLNSTSVPPILAATLVSVNQDDNDAEYLVVGTIRDGSEIDLSRHEGLHLNVLAESQDHTNTGSVGFDLSGPVSINRSENFYIYTMAVESENLSVDGNELPIGTYFLDITPYSEPNMEGDSGQTFNISFEVVRSATGQPDSQPTQQLESTINAANDFYVVEAGTVFNSGNARSVSQNDSFDGELAVFSVVTSVANGQLNLNIDGSFTYTPSNGFEGLDSFTYLLTQGSQTSQATAQLRVDSGNADEGFTEISASADSRVIFVSSSEGDDSNDCLSELTPCETITEGIERMRSGFPDHILLRRGDRWRVENRALDGLPSGRSSAEPAVISYYGDIGNRPIIESDAEVYRQDRRLVEHLWFIGLEFYSFRKDPDNPQHDPSAGDANLRFIGRFNDVLVEDNKFNFSAMTIQSFDGNRPANFVVRRNIFTGHYDNRTSFTREARPSNIFTNGVDGQIFEDNVFDFGGWNPTVVGAGANQLSHNVYLQWQSDGDTTVFRNNISVRAASHGIQMRPGGLAEDNFFAQNAIGLLMGYDFDGREPPTDTTAIARDNVITEGRSMFDKGVNPCVEGNLCTQALWGLHVVVNSEADFQAHDNIASNASEEARSLVRRGLLFDFDNGQTDFPETGNIAYAWNSPDQGTDEGYSDPEQTLEDYNAFLRSQSGEALPAGLNDFDHFMDTAKNRPAGTWDERYSARAINAFIRAGLE